ncbi:MAG: TolC family protein [Candidatus Delongbacteria bacterium]|nr:TolC family protein [Candidatus Delongbacteria bacterium]
MKRYFFLFLILLLSTYISADSHLMPLSLEKALELGIKNSRQLQISRSQSIVAEANYHETGTYLLPSLRFSASALSLSEEQPFEVDLSSLIPGLSRIQLGESITHSYSLRFSVQQPLFTGMKLINARRAARYQSESAEWEVKLAERELKYQIESAYWNLYQAIQIENLINETILQLQSHLTDIENYLQQGLATQNEVLKIKTHLSQVLIRQIEASNTIRLGMNALNSLIGLPLDNELELTSQIISRNIPADPLPVMIDYALHHRPELKSLQAAIQAGKAGIRIAQSGWWPQIALIGNYTYANPNTRIIPPRDRYDDTWDVGIYLTMDLWNWGLPHHQSVQAKAVLNQVTMGYRQMEDAITLEVTQDYLNALKCGQKIKAARLGVEQAEENYRVTQQKFKNGIVINSELLDAETALLSARTALTQAMVEDEIAGIRLSKSSGQNW